jgi:hypothetical protein
MDIRLKSNRKTTILTELSICIRNIFIATLFLLKDAENLKISPGG